MILQNVVPSRKRRRKKKEAAILHQRLKEKEEDEVEKDHSLQDQIPARRTKALEAKAPRERRSRYVAKSGKPAAFASTGTSANSGMPPLANLILKEPVRQGTLVHILIGLAELTLPKQTSLPLDLL